MTKIPLRQLSRLRMFVGALGSEAIQKQLRSLRRSPGMPVSQIEASYSMVVLPLIFSLRQRVRPLGAKISAVSPENEIL